MARKWRQLRKRDLARIKRLFVTDDAGFERLALIARLELETRLYAGGGTQV